MDAKFSRPVAGKGATASPLPSRGQWLVRTAEFDAVYRQGRRKTSAQFAVFYRSNGLGIARFGISLKRSLGNAVRRNRIRRRTREILRIHCQGTAPGWDIVIHPRSSVAVAPFGPLAAELTSLVRSLAETPRNAPAASRQAGPGNRA